MRSHLGGQEGPAINAICDLEDDRVGLRLKAAGL